MPALLEGAADVVLITGLVLLIGMLYALRYTIVSAFKLIDVSIAGLHPFHGIATSVENAVLSAVNAAIHASEDAIAGLWKGTVWSFEKMWDATKYLAAQTLTAFGILTATTIPGMIRVAALPLWHLIGDVPGRFASVAAWITAETARLEAVISRTAEATLTTAERHSEAFARGIEADVLDALHGAEVELRRGIEAGVRTAESFAQHGIDDLRRLEDAAIAGARAVESADITALRDAEQAAVRGIEDVLGQVEGGLQDLIRAGGASTLAALAAAVPALYAIVQTLEAETGLGNAECRSKIRGVCGTDPAEWAGLLLGVAFLEGALSLSELVPVGRAAIGELAGVIRQAA